MLKVWKKKLIKLETIIRDLNNHKLILINIFNEINNEKNVKLNYLLNEIDLREDISYLNDWINFYAKYIEKYMLKIRKLMQIASQETPEAAEKEHTLETEKIPHTKENVFKEVKLGRSLIIYGALLIVLSLIIFSIFLLKPSITGHAVLSKETAYNSIFNLKINESGNYTWIVNKTGKIKSIKAAGSFAGNGTVKIYIQKDGKKYLVFDNKRLINASIAG